MPAERQANEGDESVFGGGWHVVTLGNVGHGGHRAGLGFLIGNFLSDAVHFARHALLFGHL
jgi:hypothetical protein